jgi:diguanylate cyclase (GGDEF)-like protein
VAATVLAPGPESAAREHPRTIGWLGTVALAMGGSNQSLFLVGAIVLAQGSAAVPLLIGGLLLSWAALPGWTELILMWPKRVGGIAATCAEAFRPYSPVLANLTGVSYWWGWIPTCGLTALLSAAALHEWYMPGVPVKLLASAIVVTFTLVNLAGVRWATRVAIPVAFASATLALLSVVVPVLSGEVDWHRATSFALHTPFSGVFGAITSAMAGLYLVGFAAPAFEAAACHVGETIDPVRNVPRAMYRSAAMAGVYFIAVPVVWLGVIGPAGLETDLMLSLGPTFAPLLAGGAKAAAIWFMVFNMFHGTLQPLAGAARTMSQLSDDGLLPRAVGLRNRFDAPWVATTMTAVLALVFLQSGDPPWVIAAANFCYLIGIGMPSVAVWLLRRNAPDMPRPYRAPRGTIVLGLLAGGCWLGSTFLGLEQFGLPTVIASLGMAYSGSLLYAWRRWHDTAREPDHGRRFVRSLHAKLTGAMVAVMVLDGAGYLLAVQHVSSRDAVLIAVLKDIFVAVAILTVSVGLVLPGMIAHAVSQVADGAQRLAGGTIADLTRAMGALSRGDLDAAHARADVVAVEVRSADEVGRMAHSFNAMQHDVARAAVALGDAREGLRANKDALARSAARQSTVSLMGQRALEGMPLGELMDEATARAATSLDARAATLLQVEPGAGTARVRSAVGLPGDPLHARLPVERAGAGERVGAGEAIAVPDWETEDRWRLPELLSAIGVRSSLTVPVASRSEPFGWLSVHWERPRTATRDEIDFLAALAHLLANAIDRDRSEQEIRHQALHDPLTGLPNRMLFVDRLGLALAQCERRGTGVAVLFLDLDHFKIVNDSYGHSAGDELLRALAARLVQGLRPGDTVARFGGDEFVVICDDLGDASEAERIAQRMIADMSRPFDIAGADHVVSASIGIALAEGARRDPEDLVREADAAMYRAKERGRGRSELYDELMRARALSRLRIEGELRTALDEGQLRLHYQPIVDLTTGGVRGVEALIRWQHPERGLLGPAEFISVAEETGAIIPVGTWVLHAACRQAAAWHAERPDDPPFFIAVNVSSRQIGHPAIVDTVAHVLAETGLDPGALHLEITESVLMDDPVANAATLERLRGLGARIALDDFGTGYSSLAYIRRFPIDVIKIDREFVPDVADNRADAAIVDAVVSMGRGLGASVIAEGVETPAQEASLRALGCTLAQGFLYARPAPAEEIAALLGTRAYARAGRAT